MIIIKSLLIVFLVHSSSSASSVCRNCAQTKADLPVEQLRQLRYEYLKDQILKKLHLTEAPKTNLPKPPLKSLLVIADIAENETVLETDDQAKVESVVIYPQSENLSCSRNEPYPCCRFEFVVPATLTLENILSAEVWFYENPSKSLRVHQVIIDDYRNLTQSFELDGAETEKNRPWINYNIPSLNLTSNFTLQNTLVIEATSCSSDRDYANANANASASSEEIGEEKPFLVIRSEKVEVSSRRRRSITCEEGSTSCCKENFFLNFSEIGWANWILHPDGYQANFCRGRCFNEISSTRFYHSTLLLSYIRDNKDIAEEMGLSMCCNPSSMAPVAIIYRDDDGLIYHKNIDNMKVESCDCA